MSVRDFLRSSGLPPDDLHELPDSPKRFPDGAQYRVEIPSTEGPRCLEAVLEQAAELDVRVHRISQGSGVFMQTDAELDEMARLASDARVEVSLFARPGAAWGLSATARAHAGFAAAARGQEQLVANLEDCVRAAEHGFRSVLIADVGVLAAFGEARDTGLLPAEMQAKISVMLPAANAATARVFERLGRLDDQPADRLDARADRRDSRSRGRAARRVRGSARQRRRLHPPSRDAGADPRRVAGLRQVRLAQRARRLSRRLASRGDDDLALTRARAPRAARARTARTVRLRAVDVRARRRRARRSRSELGS